MLFSSFEFIFLFLPIAFFGYFILNRYHLTLASKIWLIAASLFFYSWWNISYLPLIVLSLLINYQFSLRMISFGKNSVNFVSKKFLLYSSLVFNIGLLAYFKYMDFFIQNFNFTFSSEVPLLHLVLPLGISFYTLQQIAHAVDSYEGLVKDKSFLNYAIFVTFFPQLIAGPIVHHKKMMPQFGYLKNKVISPYNIAAGIFVFSIGLFKKIVIADSFSVWATQGFDHAEVLTFVEAWVTSLSYTFQLYFDFSGYSDMAIGAALLFNIRLPINFNSPLKAPNIIDFWKRWHITLSEFITNYIYIPIIFSNLPLTFTKAMVTTVVTMLIAGLWHGASWMFVIFGLMHGIALVINHMWHKLKIHMPVFFAWFLTFQFVNLSLIVFRSQDLNAAFKVLSGMLGMNGLALPAYLVHKFVFLNAFTMHSGGVFEHIGGSYKSFIWVLAAFFIVLIFKNSMQMLKDFKPGYKNVIMAYAMFTSSILSMGKVSEFIYFNF